MNAPKSVAVVGSLNADYFARVENLPGPGETVASEGLDFHLGGKGANQAIAARRQGCEVVIFGAVGDDEAGQAHREALAEEGVDISRLATAPDHHTGTAFIVVERSGENFIVTSAGANDALAAKHIRAGAKRIESCSALLAQFEIPFPPLLEAARIANGREIPVIVNPSPVSAFFPWQEIRIDCLIVNEREAAEILELLPWEDDFGEVRGRLHEMRVENLIVTRGGEETFVCGRGAGRFTVPTLPVLPVDTVGAGDAFAGCFAARLACGEPLEAAVRAANCAGALSTLGPGAQTPLPNREKVDQHLEHLLQGI